MILTSLFFWAGVLLAGTTERAKVEVPYQGGMLSVVADRIESVGGSKIQAEGQVEATFQDNHLTAKKITYDPDAGLILVEGDFEWTRAGTWLRGTRAEIHVNDETGIINDPYGFTDEQVFLRAKTLTKTGPRTYVAEDGYITACEDAVPKWAFKVKRAVIEAGKSARFSNTVFEVKKIPLFYLPYVYFPSGKKERSSGFMLPTIGRSNNKGFRFTNRFYWVLGRSADAMIQHDYYSLRGHGGAVNLRTRPTANSSLDLQSEFVSDRKGQGGASIEGIGYTTFGNGFRGVTDFSLATNFRFRQTFSDSFFTATRPTEESRLFLTNNRGSRSFNLLLAREETLAVKRNVIIQTTPSFNFKILGRQIGLAHLDLDTSVGGLNRSDAVIETPKITQRLDFFPRAYFSIPIAQGLRLTPGFGVHETFYSDSMDYSANGARRVSGDSLHREYAQFDLGLSGWGLARVFGEPGKNRWKHLIEPQATYRLISGIDEFDRIVRYDSLDAVADTNEIEYAIVNRFYLKRPKARNAREWLSVKIGQKHFFDPDFGGAIAEGSINQFFPLNTLTGLPYATGMRQYSPITTVVRFNPVSRISFDTRADYDAETGDFRAFSATGFLRRETWTLATTYFVTQEILPGLGRSNQVQGRLGWGDPGQGFSVLGSFSYDIYTARLLNQLGRVNYYWDCCGVSLEVGGFNITTRQERQIRFSFFLKGIGNFGTIRRPEMVF